MLYYLYYSKLCSSFNDDALFGLTFQAQSTKMGYPSWGYGVIVLLILSSVVFVPIIAVLRYFGILKYQKPAPKQGEEMVIPPGSVTPSMSRTPLPPMEEPLAGTNYDED